MMRMHAERMRHQMLHLARMLRRAVHEHAAGFLRHGVRDLAFEIELLLAADVERAGEPVRRGVDGRPHAAFAAAAQQVHRRHRVAAGGMRVFGREQGRQRLDVEHLRRARRGGTGRLARGGDDGEHRLADVMHLGADLAGEDRLVGDDGADGVRPRQVGGGEHGDDAGQGADGVEPHRRDAAVRHRRQAERAVQRAGELGQVVDVGGLARHMQRGRLVRPADADAGAGCEGGGLAARVVAVGSVPAADGRLGRGRDEGAGQQRLVGLVHGRPPRWGRAVGRRRVRRVAGRYASSLARTRGRPCVMRRRASSRSTR